MIGIMYQVEPYAITITLQFFNDKTWQVHMVALKTSTLTASCGESTVSSLFKTHVGLGWATKIAV